MSETFPILNPLTPMAYMLPDAAKTFKIAPYMMIASLGAFIWDIFSNIYSDYRLLSHHSLSFPTFVYFFSRLSVLVATVVGVIFRVAPLGLKHCQNVMITTCVLYHLSVSSTSFLFFLRVRAIFNRDKYVVAFFAALWLSVVGASLTIAIAGVAGVIGPTGHCSPGGNLKWYFASSPITLFINDTCIFFAISWRLLSLASESQIYPQDKSILRFLLGRNLPAFSRAIFQDGQVYYLISMVVNLLSVIGITLPSVPASLHFTYILSGVIVNMLATRVYRHTKFGNFSEEGISTTFIESRAGHIQIDVPNKSKEDAMSMNKDATIQNRQWYETLRSRILLALIMVGLVIIPAVCIAICTNRRRRHNQNT